MLIAILIIIIIGAVVYGIYSNHELDEKIKADETKNQIAQQRQTDAYGEPTVKISAQCYSSAWNWSSGTDINSQILVYEPLRKISIKGKMYDFSQITGYSVTVNNQIVSSNTKTSMGSALGRAAVGGVLLGGAGAIIGASTAKKTTEYESKDRTVITIFTNSLSEPSIVLDLIMPDKEKVARIEGVLRIITTEESSYNTSALPQQNNNPKSKYNVGDIVTIKDGGDEIVIVDVIFEDGKTLYLGENNNRYTESELCCDA